MKKIDPNNFIIDQIFSKIDKKIKKRNKKQKEKLSNTLVKDNIEIVSETPIDNECYHITITV